MAVTIDSKSFAGLASKTNLLRAAAIGLLGSGAYAALSVSGKASGPAGLSANDVMNTIVPIASGVVTWLIANWAKVSPDFIQAGLALVRNPKDPAAWIRLITALIVFAKQALPDSKMIAILAQASQAMHAELLGSDSPAAVNPPSPQ